MIRRVLPVTLAVVLVAAGCSHHATKRTSSARSDVPKIRQAWSVAAGQPWTGDITADNAWAWTTSSSVIVPRSSSLVSYDLARGTTRWTVSLPTPLCAFGSHVNQNGIGAVLLGTDTNGTSACTEVAAVDTTTGRLLWHTPLPSADVGEGRAVEIGPSTVTVTGLCEPAHSFAVTTGHRIATFPPNGFDRSSCDHFLSSDGTTVLDANTRSAERIDGYDASTGQRRWTVRPEQVAGLELRLGAVVTDSPLTVQSQYGGQYEVLRAIDPATGSVRAVGRQHDGPPVFSTRSGDSLVVQYVIGGGLYTVDTTTGVASRRAVLGGSEQAVGMRDGRVVTVVLPTDLTASGAGVAMHLVDPAAGTQQVLGTTDLRTVARARLTSGGLRASVVGDTLVSADINGTLTAFGLPRSGPSVSSLDHTAWAGSDVRPATVDDLCTGVSATTKRAFGFTHTDLGDPATCSWDEFGTNRDLVMLSTDADALAPKGGTSAVAQAKRSISAAAAAVPSDHQPAMTAVTGLGEQAYTRTRLLRSGEPSVSLVAREGNVVLSVQVTISAVSRPVPTATAVRGARLVMSDLLAELQRRR